MEESVQKIKDEIRSLEMQLSEIDEKLTLKREELRSKTRHLRDLKRMKVLQYLQMHNAMVTDVQIDEYCRISFVEFSNNISIFLRYFQHEIYTTVEWKNMEIGEIRWQEDYIHVDASTKLTENYMNFLQAAFDLKTVIEFIVQVKRKHAPVFQKQYEL